MKTLSEICTLVLKEYQDNSSVSIFNSPHQGLCVAIDTLVMRLILKEEEAAIITKEYYKSKRCQIVFYNGMDEKIYFRSKNTYGWPVENRQARIDWLQKRI